MATYEQVIEALKKADAAGNTEDARKLARIAASMRKPSGTDYAQTFAAGINRGLAQMAGAPVDLVNAGLGLVGLGSENPVGGSKQIMEGFRAAERATGRKIVEARANDQLARILQRGGEEVGASVLPSAIILKAAMRPIAATRGFWGAFLNPIRNAPATATAGEMAAATGAGIGAGVAQEAFPGSSTAELTGQIVGGVAPTVAINTPVSLITRGVVAGARKVSPAAARMAGEAQVQHMLGTELTPEMREGINAAEGLRQEMPGFQPSLGEATGSQALIRQQERIEGQASGELLEQLRRRKEASEQAVQGFLNRQAPGSESTPEYIIDTASQELQTLRGRVSEAEGQLRAERGSVAGQLPGLSSEEKLAGGEAIRERLKALRGEARSALAARANELGINDVDLTVPFQDFREGLIDELAPKSVFDSVADQPEILRLLQSQELTEVTFSDVKALRERITDELIDATTGATPSRRKVRSLTIMRERLDEWVSGLDGEFGDVAEGWRSFRKEYFEQYIERFEKGVAFKVRQKDGRGFYVTPDERVAGSFFQPGNISAARQYRMVFGDDPTALAAVEASALDSLRDAAVRDGVIDPAKLDAWRRKFRTVLQEFPSIRQAVDNVDAANLSVIGRQDQLAARARAVEDRALVSALDSYARFKKTPQEIIASPELLRDPRMMEDLTRFLGNSPDAMNGLRRQVWDRIGSQPAEDIFRSLEANRPALEKLFSRSHLANLRKVALARAMLERTPTPRGSAYTPRPLEQVERAIGRPLPQLASRGFALQTGRVQKGYLLVDTLLTTFRNRAQMTADELLAQVLYDPQAAADLATIIQTGSMTKDQARRLQSRLFALGLPYLEEREE